LLLFDAVADPVKPHVHSFGAVLFYFVVCNPVSRGVVCSDFSWVLFPSEVLLEGVSDDGSFFSVDEEAGKLSFGGRSNDMTEDAGGIQDGSIVFFICGSGGLFPTKKCPAVRLHALSSLRR
jgi:hypothetical protein